MNAFAESLRKAQSRCPAKRKTTCRQRDSLCPEIWKWIARCRSRVATACDSLGRKSEAGIRREDSSDDRSEELEEWITRQPWALRESWTLNARRRSRVATACDSLGRESEVGTTRLVA